jgi:sec-independent protein translocase protein TatC
MGDDPEPRESRSEGDGESVADAETAVDADPAVDPDPSQDAADTDSHDADPDSGVDTDPDSGVDADAATDTDTGQPRSPAGADDADASPTTDGAQDRPTTSRDLDDVGDGDDPETDEGRVADPGTDDDDPDEVDWTTFAAGERDDDGTPRPTPPPGDVHTPGADGTDAEDEIADADAGFEFGDSPSTDETGDTERDGNPGADTDGRGFDFDAQAADGSETDGTAGGEGSATNEAAYELFDIDDEAADAARDEDASTAGSTTAASDPRAAAIDTTDPDDSAEEVPDGQDAPEDVVEGSATGEALGDEPARAESTEAGVATGTGTGTADARDAPPTGAELAEEAPVYDPATDDDLFDGPESDVEMPLADHIEEMVRRLGVVFLIAGVVGVVVFPIADDLVNFLWNTHIPGATTIESRRPRLYGPLELILTELKVAALAGFVVGLPVFVYQTYRFMRPGLYPKERKYYLAAVPTSLILAFVGVAFAHFVVLPAIFAYFTSYTIGTAVIAFGLKETFGLILVLMGYMALVFQIPLFIMLAIMMNLVTRQWLTEKRLLFWGGFLGLSFIVSPDPTGMAPIIIAATMIVLFEGTLLLLRWVNR